MSDMHAKISSIFYFQVSFLAVHDEVQEKVNSFRPHEVQFFFQKQQFISLKEKAAND